MPAFTHDPSPPVYTPSTTKKGAIAVPAPNASLASLESLDGLERRQAEIDREDELDEIRREILHLNSRLDTLLSTQFLLSSLTAESHHLSTAVNTMEPPPKNTAPSAQDDHSHQSRADRDARPASEPSSHAERWARHRELLRELRKEQQQRWDREDREERGRARRRHHRHYRQRQEQQGQHQRGGRGRRRASSPLSAFEIDANAELAVETVDWETGLRMIYSPDHAAVYLRQTAERRRAMRNDREDEAGRGAREGDEEKLAKS